MAWRDTLKAVLLFIPRQLWGFATNLWTWLTENLHLRDVVLPAIYDSAVWVSNQVPLALGGGTPGEMIEASFVLGVATFFTGFVTGGLAWALIVVWAFTGFLGFSRFVPIVGRNWPVGEWRIGDSSSLGVL
jgi:hypothetical protein